MNTTRAATRSIRVVRILTRSRGQIRLQSSSPSSNKSHSHTATALYGGLAGGVFAAILGYGWYSFPGVKTAVKTANRAKSYIETSKQNLEQAAPSPNEALEWLRKQAYFYSSFVPGGRQYIDNVLQDLDSIHDKHKEEVDKIVREAYDELKGLGKSDLSISTATQAWQILQKHVGRITDLAGDSIQEIIDKNPQLNSAVGKNIKQLQSLGDVGPDAKKIIEETWSQVQQIIAGGLSAANIDNLENLIKGKIDQVMDLGEDEWKKKYEEFKPYLDKNPQIKSLLDTNKQNLISSGTELWSKAKEAFQSGRSEALETYINQAVDKLKSGNPSLERYINEILPGSADKLMPKFNQLKEIIEQADIKGFEKLVKDTINEIEELLERKLAEGKKLIAGATKSE